VVDPAHSRRQTRDPVWPPGAGNAGACPAGRSAVSGCDPVSVAAAGVPPRSIFPKADMSIGANRPHPTEPTTDPPSADPTREPVTSSVWGSLSLRLTAIFIALLITAALAVGYLFDRGRAELLQQRQLEHLRRHAEGSADEVERFIHRLQGDVLFLAHTPPVQGIRRALEGDGKDALGGSSLRQWEERLAQIFLAFAETRPEYFQLRLIGSRDGGRELVRVERMAGGIEVTAPEALQRKGDRYYFREAARLPEESVYLSHIDLNREHNRLSEPNQPTLRAATPVRGPAGALFALIVVNLDMTYALRRAQSLRDSEEVLYVANQNGDFLLHPEAGRAFAFEAGNPFRIADAFPGAEGPITRVLPGPGIFLPLRNQDPQRIAYVTSRAWDPRDPRRRMLFIITEPMEQLGETAGLMRRDSLLGMGGLLLLAIALVIVTVRRATGSLSKLAAASKAIAKGAYAVELPEADRSEVGSLVQAFRHMAGEVERREDALAQLNRDLEERVRERTRELSRQYDLQRLILDNIADGVVVTDRDGRFILWNPKAEQIVGSGPEAVPPERWSAHFGVYHDEAGVPIPPQELPLVRAIGGASTDNAVLYLRHPGRSEGRWTEVTARPLKDSKGAVVGAVAVLVDVTERKRLQARLQRHRAELVKFGHLVLGAEIASAAAHQLSQPIAAICNYAGAAARLHGQGRLGEDELQDMLARIERLAAQGGDILNRLRARIRRREPSAKVFGLNQVVSSAVDFLEERLAREGVRVEHHYGHDLPQLKGDPLQLEHALIQLVSNALDAMEETARGSRRLSVTTWMDSDSQRVVAVIADTGPGVSPPLAECLFEPWATDKPGALGIGLTIAETIVEAMAGQIRLEPTASGGARFRVELPFATEEDA
jgi:C4-dicarboxylate-specific signal transduction histidine kinase